MARPVWRAVIEAMGIGPGSRVLDVGCGSGNVLSHLDRLGVSTAGLDPAAGMVELARSRVATAEVEHGSFERLPWPDSEVEVATAFNALQFATASLQALAERVRVVAPGGSVVIACWAEDERNDLHTLEAAVAAANGDDLPPAGPLRRPGGLENLLGRAGLDVTATGLVEVTWDAPDDEILNRGLLLGESATTSTAAAPVVLTAARPFRPTDGGYHLVNAFRFAVGRPPAHP